MTSAAKAPASDDRAPSKATLFLQRAFSVLVLGVFLLAVLSRDLAFSDTMRNAVRWAAFFGLFLGLAFSWLIRQGGGGFSWVEPLVWAFLGVGLIATLNNGNNVGGGLTTLAGFVGIYLMAFHLELSAHPARTIAVWTWSLLAVFAATVLLSLIVALRYQGTWDDNRFQGITWNPNTLGAFAALLMTGAVARSLEKGASYRLGWILLGLVGAVSLFLTQSRTALLSGVAGLIVVAILRGKWLFLLGMVLLLGLYVGARSASTSLSLGEHGVLDLGVREVGLETRAVIWHEQWEVWMEEPWLGQGLQVDKESGHGRRGAEGGYLELLGGVGILGTVPLVLAWLIAATRLALWARRVERGHDCSSDGYHLAAAGIVVALLVHAIGEGYLSGLWAEESVYFWMVVGAACRLRPLRPIAPESKLLHLKERSAERVIAAV
ncbi:MAG TPA: O-antigen ligase family protein [Gemmataceae bacterium]